MYQGDNARGFLSDSAKERRPDTNKEQHRSTPILELNMEPTLLNQKTSRGNNRRTNLAFFIKTIAQATIAAKFA